MRTSSWIVALFISLPIISGADEPKTSTLLACAFNDGETFEIELWRPSEFETPLHCVYGGSNDVETVACAPDGGWGLSWKSLEQTTLAWQEAIEHQGGKFFAVLLPTEFNANAMSGEGLYPPLEPTEGDIWELQLSRVTGEGVVKTQNGSTPFTCAVAQRKF